MEAMCHNPKERKSKSLDKGCMVERERAKIEKGKESKEKKKKGKERAKRENGGSHFSWFWVLSMGREREGKRSEKLYLLSKIYGDRAVRAGGKVHLRDESFA